MLSTLISAKAAAVALAVTAATGSVAAAAATGVLPGTDHRPTPQVSDSTSSGDSAGDQGKGSAVSELATTTDLTGVDKGAAISDLASDGKSRAGEDHPSQSSHPTQADHPGAPDGVGAPDSAGQPDDPSGAAG